MVISNFLNISLFGKTQGVPDIVNALFPNLPNFIAHILATIVLVIVLSKLVYKPFRQSIDNHRKKVNTILTDAIEKQAQANIQIQRANSLLDDAKSESLSIIKTARIDAEAQKVQIIDNATIEARNIQNQAKNSITQEKIKAQSEIKNTIVTLAFSAAEKILSQEIDKEKNKKLVDEFIEQSDVLIQALKDKDDFVKILFFSNDEQKTRAIKIIDQTFGKFNFDINIINAMKILVEMQAFINIRDILKNLYKQLLELKNIAAGVVWSIEKLDLKQMQAIENKVSKQINKKVKLTNKLDGSLIGGIKVIVEGKVFDGSIKAKLETMKYEAIKVK